jgi:hypothetical protein
LETPKGDGLKFKGKKKKKKKKKITFKRKLMGVAALEHADKWRG